jgi:hypothetical protein
MVGHARTPRDPGPRRTAAAQGHRARQCWAEPSAGTADEGRQPFTSANYWSRRPARSKSLIRSATGAVPQATVHTITSEELRSEPSVEKTLSAAGASGGKVPIGNQDGDHHWKHVRLKEFMTIECYNTEQPQERVKRSWDRECNCHPSSPAHRLPSFNIFCFFVGHSTSPLKCREPRIPLTRLQLQDRVLSRRPTISEVNHEGRPHIADRVNSLSRGIQSLLEPKA